MFEKFKSLFAFLGITSATAEETPHGVFVKEEDLLKMEGLRTKVSQLETDAAARIETDSELATANSNLTIKNDELQNQLTTANQTIQEKDTEITKLTEKLLNRGSEETVSTTGGEDGKEKTWADKKWGTKK